MPSVPILAVIVLAAALVVYNTVTNLRWPGDPLYVPRNLAVAVGLGGVAVLAGLDAADLGLTVGDRAWRTGGLAVAVVAVGVAGVVALAPRLPSARALLEDRRVEQTTAALTRAVLLRIPLGTVVLEEFAFRGLLVALLLPTGEVAAVAASSIAFGAWHVGPTLAALEENDVRRGRGALVAGGVVTTAVGGAVLAALRLESGSLLAPALAHWAVNGLGLLAAAGWQRR